MHVYLELVNMLESSLVLVVLGLRVSVYVNVCVP